MSIDKTTWIASQLQKGETASAATSRFNAALIIDNPTPQPQIPAPIDLAAIREAVPDVEAYNVLSSRIWDRIVQAIGMGDLTAIESHVKALLAGKLISLETVQKLQPLLAATISDPNWQPKIQTTPARSAGFDDVMVHEVQEILDAK